MNNKMNDFVGNILQKKFCVYGYILLSRTRRCTPICGAGMLLRCNWCRNLDAVKLHTAGVGNNFCCSGATFRSAILRKAMTSYESRSKSRFIASALILL